MGSLGVTKQEPPRPGRGTRAQSPASDQSSSHLASPRILGSAAHLPGPGTFSVLLRLRKGPGERAPGRIRSPQTLRRGRGPCSFLEAAARSSERAQGPRRLVASAHWRNTAWSAQCSILLLRSERAAGRPKVQGSLSAPPVQPNREEHTKERARAYARVSCDGGGTRIALSRIWRQASRGLPCHCRVCKVRAVRSLGASLPASSSVRGGMMQPGPIIYVSGSG